MQLLGSSSVFALRAVGVFLIGRLGKAVPDALCFALLSGAGTRSGRGHGGGVEPSPRPHPQHRAPVVGIDSRRKHGTGSELLCGLANAEGCEKEEDGF